MKIQINSESNIQGDFTSNDELVISGTNLTFETIEEQVIPPVVEYPTVPLQVQFILKEGSNYHSAYPEIRVSANQPMWKDGGWKHGDELGRVFPENNDGIYPTSIDVKGTPDRVYWVTVVAQIDTPKIELDGADTTNQYVKFQGSTFFFYSKRFELNEGEIFTPFVITMQ